MIRRSSGMGCAFATNFVLKTPWVLGLPLLLFGLSTKSAYAQADVTRIVGDVVNSAVQSAVFSARNEFQSRTIVPGSPPLGFAADPNFDNTWAALGYDSAPRNPLVTKAPPPPAPPPQPVVATVWGTGTFDYEHQTGSFQSAGLATPLNIASDSRTGSGIGGIDFLIPNFTSATGALLVGLLGGDSWTRVSLANGTVAATVAPTVGTYASYINGGFSTDATFIASFISTDETTLGTLGFAGVTTSTNLTSYNFTQNIQYRYNLQYNWWFEPTVGYNYTDQVWGGAEHALGLTDGQIWRVQGGVRAGTEYTWYNVKVQPIFGVFAYSDVSVRGGTLANVVQGSNATDEGQVWGKGDIKLNFVFSNRVSAYIEGEIHGTSGTENIIGGSGIVGFRVGLN